MQMSILKSGERLSWQLIGAMFQVTFQPQPRREIYLQKLSLFIDGSAISRSVEKYDGF
jgi:hypothetical protein